MASSKFRLSPDAVGAFAIVSIALSFLAFALPVLIRNGNSSISDLSTPPLALMVGFGLAVILGVTIVIGVANRSGLSLPRSALYALLGFNIAIIIVMFV